MRQLAAATSCLALFTAALPACGAAPKAAPGPSPSTTTGPGGTLEYDGKTTRLGHVRCWAMQYSPSLRIFFTDTPIPADVAKSVSQTEQFLNEKRVTQIRLTLSAAENPPRIVDAGVQDYKSTTNPGAEGLQADQPPYVFEKAVADDTHVAGRLTVKGAKTNTNQVPHSFDIQFDIPRGDCQ